MPAEQRPRAGATPAAAGAAGAVGVDGSWELDEPEDRWPGEAAGPAGVAAVVARCHLLGADEQLLLHGAGNFSVKAQGRDHLDRPVPALVVSGWGADARTIRAGDFSRLRLGALEELRGARMATDRDMVERLLRTALDAGQPRPAIETLVHAWLPARHVDHSHPDAVIALSAAPDGRALVEEAFGDTAVWFDYRQFGPAVARDLCATVAAAPAARLVVLANHGLLAWGEDSRECYRGTVEAARAAARLLRRRRPAARGAPPLPPAARRRVLRDVMPALRAALAAPGQRLVLRADAGGRTAAFAASRAAVDASLSGPACPDHLTHTRVRPLVVDAPAGDVTGAAVQAAVEGYRGWYAGYRARHAGAGGVPADAADRPRVVVLRDVGVVTAGRDLADAERTLDMFRQSMRVIVAALGAGGYRTLDEAACFADEHWWLQRDKPARFGRPAPLRGWVVVVDAGGCAWGDTLTRGLSGRGACVVAGRAAPAGGRVSAVEQAVLRHGGVDAVVSAPAAGAAGDGGLAPGADPAELARLLGERAAAVLRVRVEAEAGTASLRVERAPGRFAAAAPVAHVASMVALALAGGGAP